MLGPADPSSLKSFRSSAFPEAQRLPVWHRLLNKWLIETDVRLAGVAPLRGSAHLRALPDLRFGWGRFGGMLCQRSRAIASRDNDDLFLVVNLKGALAVSHFGRETEVAPGGACLMSCTEAGSYRWPDEMELLSIRMKFEGVSPLVRNIYDCVGRPVAPSNDGLRLLIHYMRLLGDSDALASGAAQDLVTRQAGDLLALALGAVGDERELAGTRSLSAARRAAAEAYVERNFARPELSAESVARHLSVSPRTLQRLFEGQGTSFTDFLLAKRLAKAHAMLGDMRVGRSVADVALSCGFANISYFNRQFRLRYQVTPSDVKHRDLRAKARS